MMGKRARHPLALQAVVLVRAGLLLGILTLTLILPPSVQAHGSAPYPILLESPVGPYVVTLLADPDVGGGTFTVELALANGRAVPGGTTVTLWVRPQDGHREEAGYEGRRQTEGTDTFVVEIPFDTEGMWQARLVVNGPAGQGERAFSVRVTPPGTNRLGSLLCLLPFLALGLLWLIGARRHRREAEPEAER